MEKALKKELAWHSLSVEQVVGALATNIKTGLSDREVKKRQKEYGPNQLTVVKKTSAFTLFINQFKNSLIIILLLATIVSGALGHVTEAIAIAIIVIFSVLLGFIQEWRAGKALEVLKQMASPVALVLRDGVEVQISAKELVPGDVVIIATGDRFPADARLVKKLNIKADEALLTGESLPVEKQSDVLVEEKASLGDRINMVFAGTNCIYGRGLAVVTGTGMHTEFGKVAGMLEGVEAEKTPLEKNLDNLVGILTKAAFALVFSIVLLGVFRGQPLLEMLIFGIALAVAVVPEALPAVVTISLAIGMQRMVKRNALIRHLPAVETLGCTTIICSDKTGTLTKDQMTVRKIFFDGRVTEVTGTGYEPSGSFLEQGREVAATESVGQLLKAAVLSSDARLVEKEGGWKISGDPTEGALIVAAQKAGMEKELLDEQFPRVAEMPFTSESKRMTTLCKENGSTRAYGKGAPEVMLQACSHYFSGGLAKPLTDQVRDSILQASQDFATQALRVIAVAYADVLDVASGQENMVFLGLFGMMDPARPEAKHAVTKCRQAGIKVMMITGDHPVTAKAIATELGFLSEGGRVVTGMELSAMSDEQLRDAVENIAVAARVSPEHKLRLVTALQSHGHIVAMTGDGVNDAPAIKKANIGIAMGIAGTDVSREASVMTLVDDNFASIVAAVEEGRVIFGNIKKYLMFVLSTNIGTITLLGVSALMGLPLPLSVVQILYVNLATDGLPAVALAVDPPDSNVMKHPPRKLAAGIFSRKVVLLTIAAGLWSALVNIVIFAGALRSGRDIVTSMTMAFVSLILIQFFKAYNFRSESQSVFHKPFANHWLNYAIVWELLLLSLVICTPFLQKPFNTTALSPTEWMIVIGGAVTIIPVLEVAKWMINKKNRLAYKKTRT